MSPGFQHIQITTSESIFCDSISDAHNQLKAVPQLSYTKKRLYHQRKMSLEAVLSEAT